MKGVIIMSKIKEYFCNYKEVQKEIKGYKTMTLFDFVKEQVEKIKTRH